jgi:hypothetical protein
MEFQAASSCCTLQLQRATLCSLEPLARCSPPLPVNAVFDVTRRYGIKYPDMYATAENCPKEE